MPRYVAMGASFTSGPGIPKPADRPPSRCLRSENNYPRILARKRRMALVDVSCSGATTKEVLGPWNEQPPQIDAVTRDTALVTINIGGNDMGYIGGLLSSACEGASPEVRQASSLYCAMAAVARTTVQPRALPSAAQWEALAERLRRINAEVRRRAPKARIVYVDYQEVLPQGRLCAEAPLTAPGEARGRAVAAKLAAVTAQVAREDKVDLLAVSNLSKGHDACSKEPWINGLIARPGIAPSMAFHPNEPGMVAVAEALDALLGKQRAAPR